MKAYHKNSRLKLLFIVTTLAGGALLTGCKTAEVKNIKPPESKPDVNVVLLPGDQIDIKFFYTPELNELQAIRPDGKISLQLVGEVMAAGFTPSQVQDKLKEQYTGLIEKPSVVVIARELVHRSVYVAGSVYKPGLVPMPGHLTALSAIMNAGGFDMSSADPKEVHIIRHENGKRQIYTLNFKDTMDGESIDAPFYLHAQDIVYVPRTDIVKVGQWIDQYITQMIPKTGFSMFYDTGSDNKIIGVDTTSKY